MLLALHRNAPFVLSSYTEEVSRDLLEVGKKLGVVHSKVHQNGGCFGRHLVISSSYFLCCGMSRCSVNGCHFLRIAEVQPLS